MPLNSMGIGVSVDIICNAMQARVGPGLLGGTDRVSSGQVLPWLGIMQTRCVADKAMRNMHILMTGQRCTSGGGRPTRSSGTPCCSILFVDIGGT